MHDAAALHSATDPCPLGPVLAARDDRLRALRPGDDARAPLLGDDAGALLRDLRAGFSGEAAR